MFTLAIPDSFCACSATIIIQDGASVHTQERLWRRNREEKSLRHVAIVAKFLDDNKPKIHLKRELAVWLKLHRSYSIPFNVSNVGDISGVESEGTLPKFRKRKRKFLSRLHLLHKAGAWNEDVPCRSRATTAKKLCKKAFVVAYAAYCCGPDILLP